MGGGRGDGDVGFNVTGGQGLSLGCGVVLVVGGGEFCGCLVRLWRCGRGALVAFGGGIGAGLSFYGV